MRAVRAESRRGSATSSRAVEIHDRDGYSGFSLSPVRYQFPAVSGDSFDDNWLVVKGGARSASESWSFEDPALLTADALEIRDWLCRVAEQTEPVQDFGNEEHNEPGLTFIEPNIAFSVKGYFPDGATVRVHLSLESSPRSRRVDERHFALYGYWLEISASSEMFSRASVEWEGELALFPER